MSDQSESRRLSEQERELAAAALPIALSYARKICRRRGPIDAEEVAHLGSIRAAKSYLEHAAVNAEDPFRDWVYICTRSVARDAIRSERSRSRTHARVIASAYKGDYYEDRGLERCELADELCWLLKHTNRRQTLLLGLMLCDSATASAAGMALGLSERTSNLEYQRAISELRRAVEARDNNRRLSA